MILPCEVAVKSVIPAVKALIAQKLIAEHGLKQDQVAEMLGMSQSAVSKYFGKVRGHVIRIDDMEMVQLLVDNMTDLLMSGTYQRSDFLQLFCQACVAVRKTSVMCAFCQKSSRKLKIEECGFCTELNQSAK
jgi:predicted transcriptional regulator